MPKILVRDLYERGLPRSSLTRVGMFENPRAFVTLELEPRLDSVLCSYHFTIAGREDEVGSLEIELELTSLRCGKRTWFRCPGCATRVGILYITPAVLACRKCSGFRYRSQIDPSRPVRTRAEAIRAKLGPPLRPGGRPTRPKGQHRATYERMRAQLWQLEAEERVRTGEQLDLLPYLLDRLEHPDEPFVRPYMSEQRGLLEYFLDELELSLLEHGCARKPRQSLPTGAAAS